MAKNVEHQKSYNHEDFEIGNSTIRQIREETRRRWLKRYPGWIYVPGTKGLDVVGRGAYDLWAVRTDNVTTDCIKDELMEKYQLKRVNGELFAKTRDDVMRIRQEYDDFKANKNDKAQRSFVKFLNVVVPEEICHSMGFRRTKPTHYQFFRDFSALNPKVNTIRIGYPSK